MITIDLDPNGTGSVTLPTRVVRIASSSLPEGRDQAINVIGTYARETGAPADATVSDSPGVTLTIHPDGRVEERTDAAQADTGPMPVVTPAHPAPELIAAVPPRPAAPPAAQPPAPGNPYVTAVTGVPSRSASFVREGTPAPQSGIQSVIYKLSGGMVNIGPGAAERYKAELHDRTAKTIAGTRNITFMCLKGGISKTSSTLGVGLTLAEHRPDSVLAIDANPDAGDLADRALGHEQVEAVSPRTITDLVHAIEAGQIDNLTDLNRFTQTSGRLHLLAGEQDPAVSESLTAEEYIQVRDVADRFYPITLTDCGTGVTHPAMKGILENAQQIVVASGWAVTGAKRAERTLTWLHQAHNGAYAGLARNAIVVLTDTGTTSKEINRDQIVQTLGDLCRAVHLVPFDPGVAKGDLVRLSDLRPQTRQAYLEVGATIIDAL